MIISKNNILFLKMNYDCIHLAVDLTERINRIIILLRSRADFTKEITYIWYND